MARTIPPFPLIAKWAALGLVLLAMSACSLPRGAALTSEIVNEEKALSPTYQVVRVSRANVPTLAGWPETGKDITFRWPKASRGPQSAIIRAGDKVNLAIWDNQDNSLLTQAGSKTVTMPGLTVSPSGSIFVPYVEEVVVKGQTPAQARREVQNRMSAIVPSAQVQLELQPGQNNSVNLVSGVARPGSYPLPDRNHKILSLIAEGGGIAPSLRNPRVQLQRGNNTYRIRAQKLFANSAHNITLRGGDSVMVLEDERYFTAFGATGTEQLIHFEQDEITALEALSILGGLSDSRANPKGVLVLRDYDVSALRSDGSGPNKAQVVFAFDVTSADGLFAARKFQIQAEDTVMATESSVTSVRTILGLVGSVFGVASRVQNY